MKRPTNIHIRYTKDYPAELGISGIRNQTG